ncbi:MAG TPA: helix-turn-helix domain-containing protein [Steroidobacteraceae bacterium]|nr:helix-turn-helix domain-containing protein [Steroidobacteraceae bacterium]
MLFAILPEVVLLDVAGAAEAFRIAEREAPGNYQLRFVSTQSTVRAAVGLQLDKLELLPATVPDHGIIVVTGVTTRGLSLESAPATALVRWLKRTMQNETITLLCVCAGALLAAKAGVLEGRECTTHHHHIDDLKGLEPTATVHANRIFVEDGRVFTSAGVTAGTDLTLHVIGQQLGHSVAATVARDLVVYMRRSGGDPQLSPWVMHRNHVHPVLHRVQDAVIKEPAAHWSAARLASVACMSSRNLARLFAEHAGCSPLDYVQRLRVALARELVTQSELGMERVAEKTGFSSAHQLRRVWRRWEASPPAKSRCYPSRHERGR